MKTSRLIEGFLPPLIKENFRVMKVKMTHRDEENEEEQPVQNYYYILNTIPILFYINFFLSLFYNITTSPKMNGGELLLRALLAGIFDIFYLAWFILNADSRLWLGSFKK